MRTDLADGTTVEVADGKRRLWRGSVLLAERDLTAEEQVLAARDVASGVREVENDATRQALADGIAELQDALTVAQSAATAADARAAAATQWATDLAARAVIVRGIPNPTPQQLRDEVGLVYDRLGNLAGAVRAISTDQALAARGIALAYQDIIGVARILQRGT